MRERVVVGRTFNLEIEGQVTRIKAIVIHHIDRDILEGIPGKVEDAGGRFDREIRTGFGRLFNNFEGNARIGIAVLRISNHRNLD